MPLSLCLSCICENTVLETMRFYRGLCSFCWLRVNDRFVIAVNVYLTFTSCCVGSALQVSLWKENVEGQWSCISSVVKGQGQTADSVERHT
jgi:hypothetical protein